MPPSTDARTGDPVTARLETAYVGLGANLGEPRATLSAALALLAALSGTTLVAASSFYRSAPVAASGPDYLNAVAELATRLGPQALLIELQRIERRFGRERPKRNAPRTLDLDLLLYGERCLDAPGLQLPHPRLHERAFVLEPLAEIAPHLVLPGRGPLAAWRQRAAGQRIEKLDAAGEPHPGHRQQ